MRALRGILIGAVLIVGFFPAPAVAEQPPYSYYAVGDIRAPRPDKTQAALLLSGGGDWVLDAFRWFAAKAGHGHVVMLGAYGGGEDGQHFYRDVGGVKSVETLVFNSRAAASDPKVLAILARADGIFIEGGDQSKYVRFWKGTPVARLIDQAIRSGKPVGGTSAGLAVLGGASYGAMDGGSIDSDTAVRDPLGPAVTIVRDFLHMPFLRHVVTDTHFTARNRLGRLVAFVAHVRATSDPAAIGLGVDQESALCVDSNGIGRLLTNKGGFAWLLQPASRPVVRAGAPLDYPLVRATGVGPASAIDLKTMRVSRAAFRKLISVKHGVLSAPSQP
jgi:beta-aspartyl-peptidase (threonine type)